MYSKFHSSLQAKKTNKPPARKPVQKGDERVGTGRFDALDEEILKAIMSRVPFVTLLACATSTCKAWRSLRDHASLWNKLQVYGNNASFTGYNLPGLASYRRDSGVLPPTILSFKRIQPVTYSCAVFFSFALQAKRAGFSCALIFLLHVQSLAAVQACSGTFFSFSLSLPLIHTRENRAPLPVPSVSRFISLFFQSFPLPWILSHIGTNLADWLLSAGVIERPRPRMGAGGRRLRTDAHFFCAL